MSRSTSFVLLLVLGSLAGCGGGSDPASGASSGTVRPNLAALARACGNPAPKGHTTPSCTTTVSVDGHEPPCNPHLAQSRWATSHRNSYAQASSPFPAVTSASAIGVSHRTVLGVPVIINFTEPDAAGHVAAWASTVGVTGAILKFDAETMTLLDSYTPKLRVAAKSALSVSGAYNLLDRDQHLIVGRAKQLEVYGDSVPGHHLSGIQQLQRFSLPDSAFCRPDKGKLVGLTMLYDGYVAFATSLGNIGVVPRYPWAMCPANLVTYSINGAACDDESIPADELERVSNSIAAGEDGGIYVVTSAAMYRINWNGQTLTQGWRVPYAGAGQSGAGRLGSGSGTTPTLMGTAPGDDKFVVITDGQKLMHLNFYWRGEIPADWKGLGEDKPRRLACSVPIDFGHENATASLTAQSVLVRGYAAVVVNNLQGLNALLSLLPARAQPFTQLLSGLSIDRPHGLERVDWDPVSRSCDIIWTNPDISIPNGIPTMSAATGLIYGIGSRTINGLDTWTLEAIDFDTGQSRFYVPTTPLPSSNSFFAAMTIGPHGSVWTGTFGGITRFRNCKAGDGRSCDTSPNLLNFVVPALVPGLPQ